MADTPGNPKHHHKIHLNLGQLLLDLGHWTLLKLERVASRQGGYRPGVGMIPAGWAKWRLAKESKSKRLQNTGNSTAAEPKMGCSGINPDPNQKHRGVQAGCRTRTACPYFDDQRGKPTAWTPLNHVCLKEGESETLGAGSQLCVLDHLPDSNAWVQNPIQGKVQRPVARLLPACRQVARL